MNGKMAAGIPARESVPPGGALNLPQRPDGSAARLVTLFGSCAQHRERRVHYVFDADVPVYHEIVLPADAGIRSITPQMPAAAWYEREIHDQYGVDVKGHPDLRPLVFHEDWPADVHPMAGQAENVPRSKGEYRFLEVQGEGVAEVAVGPVHAGIIEPGHFRFSVVGDTVLHLELRHFYTHKGAEKLFEGRLLRDGTMIAESVSGDNCFAHAVAYSQAVEAALNASVPPRAAAIRLIGLELERLISHIGDVGGLCTDVGFGVAAAQAARIKESLLQASWRCCKTRYWRGIATPGGLRVDMDSGNIRELAREVARAARDFADLAGLILGTPSIQNRFEGAGILPRNVARDLAVVGPVTRASGIDLDVRRDHPSGYYNRFQPEVPVTHYGDVMARARIRIEEAAVSGRLIQEASSALPAGSTLASVGSDGGGQGYSAVESPRGELFYWVEARDGRLVRCHIKSPSFQNWPAMPFAVIGNVIADFPLINKSFNLSYSGCDR